MAFTLKGAKAAPKRTMRMAGSKTYATIFDTAIAKFRDKLTTSIIEANGRYGPGWEDRAAGAATVQVDADKAKNKAYAAPFWSVVYVEEVGGEQHPHPDTDIVKLKLKVGNKAWAILPAEEGDGLVEERELQANSLIATLNNIQQEFDNMSEDMKSSFHAAAIEMARPPKDKKIINDGGSEDDCSAYYDKEQDRWIKKEG